MQRHRGLVGEDVDRRHVYVRQTVGAEGNQRADGPLLVDHRHHQHRVATVGDRRPGQRDHPTLSPGHSDLGHRRAEELPGVADADAAGGRDARLVDAGEHRDLFYACDLREGIEYCPAECALPRRGGGQGSRNSAEAGDGGVQAGALRLQLLGVLQDPLGHQVKALPQVAELISGGHLDPAGVVTAGDPGGPSTELGQRPERVPAREVEGDQGKDSRQQGGGKEHDQRVVEELGGEEPVVNVGSDSDMWALAGGPVVAGVSVPVQRVDPELAVATHRREPGRQRLAEEAGAQGGRGPEVVVEDAVLQPAAGRCQPSQQVVDVDAVDDVAHGLALGSHRRHPAENQRVTGPIDVAVGVSLALLLQAHGREVVEAAELRSGVGLTGRCSARGPSQDGMAVGVEGDDRLSCRPGPGLERQQGGESGAIRRLELRGGGSEAGQLVAERGQAGAGAVEIAAKAVDGAPGDVLLQVVGLQDPSGDQ